MQGKASPGRFLRPPLRSRENSPEPPSPKLAANQRKQPQPAKICHALISWMFSTYRIGIVQILRNSRFCRRFILRWLQYCCNMFFISIIQILTSVTCGKRPRLSRGRQNATNNIMNTKTILAAALVGAAAMSASAGIHFGISIGLPLPVVVSAPVIVTAPACPAPVVETVPVCPGGDYVWAPGYWAYRPSGYVWVRGGWNYRPAYVRYDHHYYGGHHDGRRW